MEGLDGGAGAAAATLHEGQLWHPATLSCSTLEVSVVAHVTMAPCGAQLYGVWPYGVRRAGSTDTLTDLPPRSPLYLQLLQGGWGDPKLPSPPAHPSPLTPHPVGEAGAGAALEHLLRQVAPPAVSLFMGGRRHRGLRSHRDMVTPLQ